jgi:protein tyrosine/serine phosphatase
MSRFHGSAHALLLALALIVSPARSAPITVAGIPNFHQVNVQLFRGGQPAPLAWPQLAALGVTTVLDLRELSEHSTTDEAAAVEREGMRYVSFPMNGFATPTAAQMARVLDLIGPGDTVFVHCKLGMDRTGVVVASYRMAREHWTNRKALDEAVSLGLHWYSGGMKRFIRAYGMSGLEPAPALAPSDSAATPALAPGGP